MPLRFYRRVHILPGVSVNMSRSGPSLSLGVRGAHVTVGRNGVSRSVGIPGTGVYYTSRSGTHTGAHYQADPEKSGIGGVIILVLVVMGVIALMASMRAPR
jgi:hypothetical protein